MMAHNLLIPRPGPEAERMIQAAAEMLVGLVAHERFAKAAAIFLELRQSLVDSAPCDAPMCVIDAEAMMFATLTVSRSYSIERGGATRDTMNSPPRGCA